MKTTRAQIESLYRLYCRNSDGSSSYLAFRRRARLVGIKSTYPYSLPGDMYLGINWCGMFIGIESDGYSHS